MIYHLLFFLLAACCVVGLYTKPSQRNFLLFASACLIVLFQALRWRTGTDWLPYEEFFRSCISHPDSFEFEFGYAFLNRAVRSVTDSYTVFLFVECGLTVFFLVLVRPRNEHAVAMRHSPFAVRRRCLSDSLYACCRYHSVQLYLHPATTLGAVSADGLPRVLDSSYRHRFCPRILCRHPALFVQEPLAALRRGGFVGILHRLRIRQPPPNGVPGLRTHEFHGPGKK